MCVCVRVSVFCDVAHKQQPIAVQSLVCGRRLALLLVCSWVVGAPSRYCQIFVFAVVLVSVT